MLLPSCYLTAHINGGFHGERGERRPAAKKAGREEQPNLLESLPLKREIADNQAIRKEPVTLTPRRAAARSG